MIDGTADLDRRLADTVERLANGLRALAQRSARRHNLSPLQQQVVLALSRQPPARREVNALAGEFDVTTPTVSDAVAALERKQLLTRSPGSDGRRRVLTLTELGTTVAEELSGWDGSLLEALSVLPVEDRATTLHTLLRVIADLQRRGAISVARTCTTCRFFRPDVYPDPAAPHRCELLQMPLPLTELRTDCPEHELVG
ncbi:MarR family winged helix-turn-helix transcriptional regulator [Cryptosporangium arvum]|uniref:MarR family winged helix-turn-helix transcriptional regulator n=1 Tax=Cryptosporangium arvum TaxID=80871 RepID=UPI0004B0B827|nr:MarR family winged helix-turn-helix transcriptional regulator [Cryptosporangium arvum]